MKVLKIVGLVGFSLALGSWLYLEYLVLSGKMALK